MARKEYKNITLKIDPYIYQGLEHLIDVHNQRSDVKKLYKVRVIEDLLFTALVGAGWLGDSDNKKNTEYRKKMTERRDYTLFLSDVNSNLPKKKRNRKK